MANLMSDADIRQMVDFYLDLCGQVGAKQMPDEIARAWRLAMIDRLTEGLTQYRYELTKPDLPWDYPRGAMEGCQI